MSQKPDFRNHKRRFNLRLLERKAPPILSGETEPTFQLSRRSFLGLSSVATLGQALPGFPSATASLWCGTAISFMSPSTRTIAGRSIRESLVPPRPSARPVIQTRFASCCETHSSQEPRRRPTSSQLCVKSEGFGGSRSACGAAPHFVPIWFRGWNASKPPWPRGAISQRA